MMRLRVQFLTNDEAGRYHVGGNPGIDLFRFARHWNLSDAEALELYRRLYTYPEYVKADETARLNEVIEEAERTIGMVKPSDQMQPRPYECFLGIGRDLYSYTDSGMPMKKLMRYFDEAEINAIYFHLRNRAGEVIKGNRGLKFYIHTDEKAPHHEPHVHVETPDGVHEVTLRIPDGMDLNDGQSGFPKKLLTRAQKIVVNRGAELMDEWLKQVDGIVRLHDDELRSVVIVDMGPCPF